MIYKMTLKDSTDEMTFNLLEVPIVDKDIEGAVDNVTLDGNQYTDYLYLKKQYIQKWSIMCDEEYERLRGFYTRQFDEAEIPTYELYYGETIYNEYTRSGDYILVDVQGVEPARMSLAQLNGNAEQTTYSGKNLLNINATPTTSHATRSISGQSITVTTESEAATARVTLPISYEADRQMTISFDATCLIYEPTAPNTALVYMRTTGQSDGTTSISLNKTVGTTTHYTGTITPDNDTKSLWLYLKSSNVEGVVSYRFDNIQIEYGASETSYEPYVGGIPSPNPSYPQPISVVTGRQTVKVVGKNLLAYPFATADGTYDGVTWVTEASGHIRGSGMTDSGTNFYLRGGTSKWIAPDSSTYTLSLNGTHTGMALIIRDGTTSTTVATIDSTDYATFTPTQGHEYRFYFNQSSSGRAVNINCYAMLEQGSTATSYQAYTEQSFTIDLGSIELAKIGTYQDRIYKDGERWYVEKQVGAKELNLASTTTFQGRVCGLWSAPGKINQSNVGALCTKATFIIRTGTYQAVEGNFYENGTNFVFIGTADDTLATLQGKYNGATILYVLATPTVTEITNQTLIDQLEALTNVSITTGIHNIFTEVASGNLNPVMILNFIEVVSRRVTLVPETPVRLTLTDGGIINACGCRKDVQLTMRETIE